MVGLQGGSGPGWYYRGKHYSSPQDLHEAMSAEMDRLELQIQAIKDALAPMSCGCYHKVLAAVGEKPKYANATPEQAAEPFKPTVNDVVQKRVGETPEPGRKPGCNCGCHYCGCCA